MWKDLTLSQKADIIKMAVKQGMRSINDIQSFYDEVSGNSGRFKDGGNLHGEKSSKNNTSKQAPWYSELDEAVLGEVMQQLRTIAHPRAFRTVSYKGDPRGKNGGTAQRTYLLPRFEQEDIFLRDGYIKGKEGDYGLVKKAVNNRNLPIWQTAPDAVSRETLVPIGNDYDLNQGYITRDKDLVHAGSHPAAFYIDGSTGKLYTKGWDLNDYGGTGGGTSGRYNIFEKVGADILDFIGNPVVVTTGFQEVTNPWGGESSHLSRGATVQDLFVPDDEGYPVATTVGQMLDDAMSKKGLHRENIDGKWLYTLPEVTVTGRKKAYGGNLGDPPMKQDTFSKSYKPPLLDQPIRFYPTVTEKKEAAQEKRDRGLKSLMEGLNDTFGTAAPLAPLIYGGGGYISSLFTSSPKRRKVYRSLTGKVFNTKDEAIKDNTDAKYGRGLYAPKDLVHSVIKGDTLWGIAKANNMDVNTLRHLNPNIKGDLIHIGDKIKIGQSTAPTLHDVRKEWEKEKVLNTDNIKAIQGIKHDNNYVIIDKLNGILTVYDKNNKKIYSTSNISTGKSGNDYNTITYVDKNGKIRSGAGNESTPAGITKITGTGVYHGYPSFTRGRHQGNGFEDIASSLHFGGTNDKKASNGCIRLDGQSLQNLTNFVGIGTTIYTLPEKRGSRFKVKDGKLSFVADNPYGKQKGDKKYWDDYNTYTDKSYSPLTIVDKKKSDDSIYSKNRKAYANAIANSKERIQQKFNIDSDTYNRIASLALGIAEQETKYGTSTRKAVKDMTPDFVLNFLRGNSNRSRGITQIKLNGDNKKMQDIYNQLGITEESLDSPENSAIATMARLSQMYNTEVLGRDFTGAQGTAIDPYDALLYKWMGRNSELSNHTATPELNNYINNVKKYQNDFGLYTMRAEGGPILNMFSGKKNVKPRKFDDKGLSEYFMNNKNVTGMAIGEGLNGIYGDRRIVLNP